MKILNVWNDTLEVKTKTGMNKFIIILLLSVTLASCGSKAPEPITDDSEPNGHFGMLTMDNDSIYMMELEDSTVYDVAPLDSLPCYPKKFQFRRTQKKLNRRLVYRK